MHVLHSATDTANGRVPTIRTRDSRNAPLDETRPGLGALYRLGGAAALVTFLLVLADIVVTMLPGETDAEPGALGATGWFAVLREQPLLGLRNLGLLNVGNLLLSIPLFAALYAIHRRRSPTLSALAVLAQLVGAAVYVANNASLPMLDLIGRYAAAATEAERSLVAAAGEALLARGEDFTPGAFPGFLLSGIGGVLMGWVVVRGGVLGRATGLAGLLGAALLTAFTAWATFVRGAFGPAMGVAAVGGLLSLAWYALVARGLLRLARDCAGARQDGVDR